MKHYFILIIKSTIFIVLFAVLDCLIGLLSTAINNTAFKKNQYSSGFVHRYCVESATPDIAIIGSSTASHHYIPSMIEDSLNLSVYNFGMDGSFFIFQNAMINLMLDRYAPSYIIWEIGESSLSTAYDDCMEYQNIRLLYPWYKNTYIKGIVDSQDSYQKIRMCLNSYINNSRLLLPLALCIINNNNTQKGYVPLDAVSHFPSKKNSNSDEYQIVLSRIDILNQTIRRCKDNNTQIIFSVSPRFFDDRVLHTEYCKSLEKIAVENDIPIINLYNAVPFNNDSSLFVDNSHMNDKGTRLYMKQFIPLLKQIIENENK